MTVESMNEFVRQNGAFGVLVLLIGAFCWRAAPWFANRFEALHVQYGKQLEDITASHERAMTSVTQTLEWIRDDLSAMRKNQEELHDRMKAIETVVRQQVR